MRPSAALVAAVCCLLLSLASSGCDREVIGSSSASACVRQVPSAEPSGAAPGESFRLRGPGFRDGCNDPGQPFPNEPPQREIRVDMRQGGESWNLASGLEAGGHANYVLEARLEVPAGAQPGKARLVVSHPRDGRPLKVPFRVIDGGPPG